MHAFNIKTLNKSKQKREIVSKDNSNKKKIETNTLTGEQTTSTKRSAIICSFARLDTFLALHVAFINAQPKFFFTFPETQLLFIL
jgi:hypothetical protein